MPRRCDNWAALNGFDLVLERAADLVAALQTMLALDTRLAALDLGVLPAVGLPWTPFTPAAEETPDAD